ncbi:MAG: DUF1700 domain-containing protein [Suilimivivens sp.]
MTKQEFLLQLQRTLNGSIGSNEAESHVSYYREYIEIEMRKGRTEEEVTTELGDPKLIAKSIADALQYRDGSKIKDQCFLFCADICNKVKSWFEKL